MQFTTTNTTILRVILCVCFCSVLWIASFSASPAHVIFLNFASVLIKVKLQSVMDSWLKVSYMLHRWPVVFLVINGWHWVDSKMCLLCLYCYTLSVLIMASDWSDYLVRLCIIIALGTCTFQSSYCLISVIYVMYCICAIVTE